MSELREVYVCVASDAKTPFTDNVSGVCDCGTSIMWRPHAPPHVKKVCMPCAVKLAEAEKAKGEPVILAVTQGVAQDIRDLFESSGTKH